MRRERHHEPWPNPAASVDAPIGFLFAFGRPRRRATEQRWLGRNCAMRTIFTLLLLMPLIGMGAEVRIAREMPYQAATDLLLKQGGVNITTNVGWLYSSPQKWSFWDLRGHNAVVVVIQIDGKVTHLGYWTRSDFSDWEHRSSTEHRILSLTFNSDKTLSWETSEGPNPQGGANPRQPSESETNQTSAAAASRRSP